MATLTPIADKARFVMITPIKLGEFDQIAPNARRFLAGTRIRARQLLIKKIRKACTLIQINLRLLRSIHHCFQDCVAIKLYPSLREEPMVTGFHRGWLFCAQRVAAILLCLGTAISAPVLAQSPPPRPSGTVSIHQIQVAFIGSGMLGGGTLSYRGAAYRFRLGGLGIGGVGVSRLDATGTVYNLRRLTDFEGVYGQVRSGWAAGDQGRGSLWMQNANGVYLRLIGVRRGLSLTMGADGVRVEFER